MSNDTREALAALMVIAAECAQRKPLRGFEELTEATHIGHRQFGRAHEQADEAVRMLAVRLRAVFDTLAAALATQPAPPSSCGLTECKNMPKCDFCKAWDSMGI